MGTRIVLGLTGAAITFMLYALFHFVQEGRRQHPRNRPVVTIAVVDDDRREHEPYSKAA
jgi:hypothetical protein